MTEIAFIAAMPEETAPFLRRVSAERELLAGLPLYRFTLEGHSCCLIESGMGTTRAKAAAQAILEHVGPKVIINYGFCGAASPGPTTGDLIVAGQVFSCRSHRIAPQAGLSAELTAAVFAGLQQLADRSVGTAFLGTFLTTVEVMPKKSVAPLLREDMTFPALEMETAAVAEIAEQGGIPMMALRAVSDDAEEELGFSVSDFTDASMTIRPGRVLLTIMKKPWIIPQLYRLSRNIKIAGDRMAAALMVAAEVGGRFAAKP